MAPALLVLAAGMSSRYGGSSKQTDSMGPHGETLLDYSVFDAKRAGFGRIVFVIRREDEAAFRERVVSRLAPHLPVALAYQEMTDLPAGFTLSTTRTKPWLTLPEPKKPGAVTLITTRCSGTLSSMNCDMRSMYRSIPSKLVPSGMDICIRNWLRSSIGDSSDFRLPPIFQMMKKQPNNTGSASQRSRMKPLSSQW